MGSHPQERSRARAFQAIRFLGALGAAWAFGCSSSSGGSVAGGDFCGALAIECNTGSRDTCDNVLAQDATDHPRCRFARDVFLKCLAGKSLSCDGTSVFAGVPKGSGKRYDLAGYSAYADDECASSGDDWANCAATGPVTWTVADATWGINSVDTTLLDLDVASYSNMCGHFHKPYGNTIDFAFVRKDTSSPFPKGTYPIKNEATPPYVFGSLIEENATCHGVVTPDAVDGSVTIDADLGVPGTTVTGHYDLQFADGKTATASFSATSCDLPEGSCTP